MANIWNMNNNNVKNTKAGKINNSFNLKKSKAKKFSADTKYSNVRLSIRAISRLNAYQKLFGLKNRTDALNQIMDTLFPNIITGKKKAEAKTIEKLFEANHAGRNW